MCFHIIANKEQNWQKTWTKIGVFVNSALMDMCYIVFVFCLPRSQGEAQNTNHASIISILLNTCFVEKHYLLGARPGCQVDLYHLVCFTYNEVLRVNILGNIKKTASKCFQFINGSVLY